MLAWPVWQEAFVVPLPPATHALDGGCRRSPATAPADAAGCGPHLPTPLAGRRPAC